MRRSRLLEGPIVRLGDGTLVTLGQSDAGHVYPDQPPGPWRAGAPGAGLVVPRAPFQVNLTRSGERGAPLTALRRLRVLPYPSGAPQPEAVPPVDLTAKWPWLFAPRDNWPISRANAPATVAAGGTNTIPIIARGGLSGIDEVPRGYRGVIKRFGQTAADFTNLVWTFLVKGRPTDPVVNMSFQFAALNQPLELPGAVLLEPGDDFVIQVTNTGVAAVVNVAARADLYLWRS